MGKRELALVPHEGEKPKRVKKQTMTCGICGTTSNKEGWSTGLWKENRLQQDVIQGLSVIQIYYSHYTILYIYYIYYIYIPIYV